MAEAVLPEGWANEGGEVFHDDRGRVAATYHDIPLSDSMLEQLTAAGFDGKKFRVKRVRRVQSMRQVGYVRQTLHDDGDAKMTTLYHGTTARDASLAKGLDDRLSPGGCFGPGLYFTPRLGKADRYAGRGRERRILVCGVALGRIYLVAKDHTLHTLRREPHGYDSVQGEIRGVVEHVVYERRRAQINYIIDYERIEDDDEEKGPTTPGVAKPAHGAGHAGKSVH